MNRLIADNEQVSHELKLKEAELNMNRSEVRKVNKIRDALIKKNLHLEELKVLAEEERSSLKAGNAQLGLQTEALKKTIDGVKKTIEDLTRERDMINVSFAKTEDGVSQRVSYSGMLRQTRGNLELDLDRLRKEVADSELEVSKLSVEKDRHVSNAVSLQESYLLGLNDLRDKESLLFEYKKRTSVMENKLKHQQNVYESVLSDRNLHSKHLVQAQSDIQNMKRTLKGMNFSISGFKDEIQSKDVSLSREVLEVSKLKKDMDALTEEMKTLSAQNELAQAYIKTQVLEESKLNQFVREAEDERTRQEKALGVVLTERDTMSGQLMRQNEELVQVYGRIKTQQTALIRGEIHYTDKLKAIRDVRDEIQTLRVKKRELVSETSELGDSKRAVQQLDSELTRERTRLKALEEELESPINVHRWRKIEGSNPQEFELIQVIQMLQKKLITKSKEDRDKEDAIEHKEELYLHLKTLLAKQVGPEAIEQISEFETILKDKNLQLKHMGTELNMYQAQVREYKYSIEQLDKVIDGMKRDLVGKYKSMARAVQAQGQGQGGVSGKSKRLKSALKNPLPPLRPSSSLSSSQGDAVGPKLDHEVQGQDSPIVSPDTESAPSVHHSEFAEEYPLSQTEELAPAQGVQGVQGGQAQQQLPEQQLPEENTTDPFPPTTDSS